MHIDCFISNFRSFRQELKNSEAQEVIMTPYMIPKHTCQNPFYINKGYYRKHNGEFLVINQNQSQKADFLILECETCHQEIYLFNTGAQNWDILPNIERENEKGSFKK